MIKNSQFPLVSILIPVYNREGLIIETLESIAKQTYSNWECIIVDDGSTDHTVTVVKKYALKDSRFKVFKRPDYKIKGACSCRNYAFEKAIGVFVNWFDSDDIMHQDFIKLKSQVLIEDATKDVVISKTSFFSEDADTITGREDRTQFSENLLEDFITRKVSWYMPDGMWRTSFFNAKELFDENLLFGQDRMFHYQRLLEAPRLEIIDHYLTKYRKHDNTISATYFSLSHKTKVYSHINASQDLLMRLKSHKKLSKNIKIYLFAEGIMYLPYCICTYEKPLKRYLLSVFSWNFKTIKNAIKVIVAYVFYKFTGKGYAILKL